MDLIKRTYGGFDSLNSAYDVDEGRPFRKVRCLAIRLTIGLSAFLTTPLILLTYGPQNGARVADLFGLSGLFEPARVSCTGSSL